VMTDSSTLKNSQTVAEGPQSSIFVSHLCLLAEMSSWSIIYCSSTAHDEHTD
jgi:hypothetical protein